MCKLTQMNEEIFCNHLLLTIEELKRIKNINFNGYKFFIVPIEEKGKILDGGEEMMKRLVLSKENIGDKKLSINETCNVLGGLFPKAPIWINVSFFKMEEDTAIFKIETSLRFRKPSLLRNAETGHAPFKVIL